MKPPFYFVRDKGSRVAHHWDYQCNRRSRALCGYYYVDEIVSEGYTPPSRVCRACQDVLPRFEAKWWREAAQQSESRRKHLEDRCATADRELKQLRKEVSHLTYELGLSQGRIETLKTKVTNQAKKLHELQSARAAANRAAAANRRGAEGQSGSSRPVLRRVAPARPPISTSG